MAMYTSNQFQLPPPSMPSSPYQANTAHISRWHVFIAWLLRTFYFRRIRIVGAGVRPKAHQLILCSHRNGAIDGYCVMAAFAQARFLASVQLLRFWLLRLMFTGIAVVRDKDRERYGISPQAHANPIAAACNALRAGEILATFPEGSSEWAPHPQPYQPGSARIVRMLLSENMPLEVVPLGLFYQAPDKFRSDVEVLLGEPITLPACGDDDKRAWEAKINTALSEALNAVSVNCPDVPTFEQVEQLAAADAANGESYALAFKRWESLAATQTLPQPPATAAQRSLINWLLAIPFIVLLWPILLTAYVVGKKADGRNTVTFFRMLGGLAMTLLWLPLLLITGLFYPWPLLALALLAWIGWRQL